jgi:uncharacterized protein YjbI with pentapeptide repeats
MADDRDFSAADAVTFIGAALGATLLGLWALDTLTRSEGGAEFASKEADEEWLERHRREARAAARRVAFDTAGQGVGLYADGRYPFMRSGGGTDLLQQLYDVVDPDLMPELAGAVKRLRYAHEHVKELGPEVFTRAVVDLWRLAGSPCRKVGVSKERLVERLLVGDPDRKKVAANLVAACGVLPEAGVEIAWHAAFAGPRLLNEQSDPDNDLELWYRPIGASLVGIELRGVDLHEAQLEAANLEGSNLTRSNLSGANLKSANLRDANLSGVNFSGASLKGAKLSDAILTGAQFEGADLSHAVMYGVGADGVDFRNAKLHKASLNRGAFNGALFDGVDLSESNAEEADLSNASLADADMKFVNGVDALFKEADLSRADLSYANLGRANLTGAKLRGADLTEVDATRAQFDNAILSSARLNRANLEFASLDGANLEDAVVLGAILAGAKIRNADLRGAALQSAKLNGADLTGSLRECRDDKIPGWHVEEDPGEYWCRLQPDEGTEIADE